MTPQSLFGVFLLTALWTVRPLRASQCGNILEGPEYVLTSENYPQPYPASRQCFYLLKGEGCTTHFYIEFLDFDLVNSLGCVKDRLEIGSQDALCGTRNGSRTYSSEKGVLKLKFISNNEPDGDYRGFKLLVRRIDDCGVETSTTEQSFTEETTKPPVEWTTKPTLSYAGPAYLPPAPTSCCQNNVYSSRTFWLQSPNFPHSLNDPANCHYVIRRANPSVCRLRFNLLFFALGPASRNPCSSGSLEIDGKLLCGCNSDLQLTASFGEKNDDVKVLKFQSAGRGGDEPSGFLLEIIQDECQKSLAPDYGLLDNGAAAGKLRHPNGYPWPHDFNIERLKMLKETTYHFPPNRNEIEQNLGSVQKHFYFFGPETEQNINYWFPESKEKEETNYVDISSINNFLTNFYNRHQCSQWNNDQLRQIEAKFGNSLRQFCEAAQPFRTNETKCYQFNDVTGQLTSPGYPKGYFANSETCYRFHLMPGYCAINLLFNDFDLERSYGCLKDFLAINEYKYCGNFLNNKQVTLNAKGQLYQDVKFVSDVNYCGRGFSAVYQQVECHKSDDKPITPTDGCRNDGRTVDEDPITCRKLVRDKRFIIRNEMAAKFCVFDVEKYSPNVCKIRLDFIYFNLPCSIGALTINGQPFCGQKSGLILNLDLTNGLQFLQKLGNFAHFLPPNVGFSIHGEQLDYSCEAITPEPVRLVSQIPTELHPDVCKLIKENVPIEELPSKICELVTKKREAIDCRYGRAALEDPNSISNFTRLSLFNEEAEPLGYEEFNCD